MIIVEIIMVGLIFLLALFFLVMPTAKLEAKFMSWIQKDKVGELKVEKDEIKIKERTLAEKIKEERQKALQKAEDLGKL